MLRLGGGFLAGTQRIAVAALFLPYFPEVHSSGAEGAGWPTLPNPCTTEAAPPCVSGKGWVPRTDPAAPTA